jgi:hypothetical protein
MMLIGGEKDILRQAGANQSLGCCRLSCCSPAAAAAAVESTERDEAELSIVVARQKARLIRSCTHIMNGEVVL